MQGIFERSELLLSKEGVARLAASSVAVFGVGGVGSYTAEALARSGVGRLILVDGDTVAASNINRQLIALHSTVGRVKVEVMRDRIRDINPACRVEIHRAFVLPENVEQFVTDDLSYVVDAIDTMAGKLAIIETAVRKNIPVITAGGAGNKLDPSRFRVSDLAGTEGCPLCRVLRRELRARGIRHIPVVWSDEPPAARYEPDEPAPCLSGYCDLRAPQPAARRPRNRQTPGSLAFVPGAAGLILAGYVVRALAAPPNEEEGAEKA